MTTEVKIICDSLAPSGVRLTTFVLKYPRFIHAELLVHREFSRNSSSSRAIPVKRQIAEIRKNMATPIEFRKNKSGMQAGEALSPFKQWLARSIWKMAGHIAVLLAQLLLLLKVHKQYANRLLEPFSFITVVLSSTRFDNFFALRCHSAAQPEIQALAFKMWEAYQENIPEKLEVGEWHLPFITKAEKEKYGVSALIKMSVARCARVSYLSHEGKATTLAEDIKLYDKLVGADPKHASPAEHQAQALIDYAYQSGNFHGWEQYRKTLKNEYISKFTKPLG